MAVSYSYGVKPTYVKLGAYSATGSETSFTFNNLPQNYTDLVLVSSVQGTTATDGFSCYYNGDNSGTSYSFTRLYGNGSTATSNRYSNNPVMQIGDWAPNSSTFLTIITHIQAYSNGTTYKSMISRFSSPSYVTGVISGLWRNTSPITSLVVKMGNSDAIKSGSTFTLYGIAAAQAPKATGGNVYTDGTYWYHAFRSSGIFKSNVDLTCDYMVIAGGGGSYQQNGGGGAGGFRLGSGLVLSSSTYYPVLVGAGGSNNVMGAAANGTKSYISTISATGGGGGGNSGTCPGIANSGADGGSGGGSGDSGCTGGLGGAGNLGGYTPVEGYRGGNMGGSTANGGGGGAGGAGGDGVSGGASGSGGIGAGGTGYTNYALIDAMASATGTGVSSGGHYYYAGGGGGGQTYLQVSNSAGAGGLGGGGAGGNDSAAGTPGTANTGGGGGSGGRNNSNGGAGGSGLVIVRYAV